MDPTIMVNTLLNMSRLEHQYKFHNLNLLFDVIPQHRPNWLLNLLMLHNWNYEWVRLDLDNIAGNRMELFQNDYYQ